MQFWRGSISNDDRQVQYFGRLAVLYKQQVVRSNTESSAILAVRPMSKTSTGEDFMPRVAKRQLCARAALIQWLVHVDWCMWTHCGLQSCMFPFNKNVVVQKLYSSLQSCLVLVWGFKKFTRVVVNNPWTSTINHWTVIRIWQSAIISRYRSWLASMKHRWTIC